MILEEFFSALVDFISGMLPLCLLLICGIYISFKGGFFQLRLFPKSIKLIIKAYRANTDKRVELSSFQAACTALSGTVGTGNIAGVSAAISIGGAGAVFWMWVSAILGMAIKCVEITLAVKFREKENGEYKGGPMYYIKNSFNGNKNFISVMFAVVTLPAVLCTGNITQVNSAVLSVSDKMNTRIIFGIIFMLLTELVILGGVKRIGTVTEKVVPLMSVLYIVLAFGIISKNYSLLPKALCSIIVGAFNPKSVTGGVVGSAISCFIAGAAKGIFSNEAGLGTSGMAHSVAYDANEKTQGLYGIIEVFIDTILICTLTALTILCSGVNIEYGRVAGAKLVGFALSHLYGGLGYYLLSIMMFFFALSSVIGWAVYGKLCADFLFGKKGSKIFVIIYPLVCFLGAICDVKLAWKLSEFFNGIMLCINLPVILLLLDSAIYNFKGDGIDRNKNKRNNRIFRR